MHKTDTNEQPIDIRIRGLEQRPLVGDPKSYVRHLVNAGFNVSTIGAMNGLGFSGYPTEYLPAVQGMDPHWISGVLKEAHAHDIKLICWNVFNIQDVRNVDDFQIAKRYPQWEMKYLDVPGVEYEPRKGMCMLSSPYLEQHAKLIQEVAGLGVDAMWFDGFYLGGIPHPIRPGCVCSFCRERFRSDYELDLPTRVDWENPAFKRWIRWRNESLMSGARFMTEKIHEVRPGLPITFNYNQWPFGTKDWPNAIPLWNTGDYGVSQHAYSPDEAMQWVMLGYKSQLSHDLNPDYSDIWRTGNPIFDLDEGDADHVAKHELQVALLTFDRLHLRYYTVAKSSPIRRRTKAKQRSSRRTGTVFSKAPTHESRRSFITKYPRLLGAHPGYRQSHVVSKRYTRNLDASHRTFHSFLFRIR
jgi:hypothetical protein